MKLIPAILFSLLSLSGFTQLTSTNYFPLECEGEIPASILKTAEEKYKTQAGTISSNDDKQTQKNKDAFYANSNYWLDRTLMSGDVLFGDTLTRYVNKIANDLLQHDPALRDQLQVFMFKSPYVNAFSTDQGMVFVNLGLLAQVANEAELAYVMAHEIVHFRDKHNTKEYIENDLITKGRGNYKEKSYHDRINAYYQYSRDLETEADIHGLKMLHNSSYNALDAKGLFDVLLYSYLPFDEEKFDYNFLKNEDYNFPEKMMMDSTQFIKTRDKVDDKKSTHPNVKKRRKSTYKYFKKMRGKTDDKKSYLGSREEFEYVRDIARFEVIRQNLIQHRYDRAIYNCYLLNKNYPDNLYLKKCLIMALEGTLQYKEDAQSTKTMTAYKKVEGSSQAVSFWLKKIKKRDLAVLTASKTYEALRENPNDKYLTEAFDRQLSNLIERYEMYEEDFYINEDVTSVKPTPVKTKNETVISNEKDSTNNSTESSIFDDIDSDDDFAYVEDDSPNVETKKRDDITDSELDDFFNDERFGTNKSEETTKDSSQTIEKSKYDKIKEKKMVINKKSNKSSDYYKYMFFNYFNETAFVNAFDKAMLAAENDLTPEEKRIKEKEDLKEEKIISKKGLALGISSLAIVEPQYFVLEGDESNPSINNVESDYKKADLEKDIIDVGEKAGLDLSLLNPKELTSSDTKSFNAIMKLKEWLNELEGHDIENPRTVISNELGDIHSSLGTQYIALPQIYNLQVERKKAPYIVSMLYIVTIPWAISKLATPQEATYYNFKVIDIETLEMKMDQEYLYYGKDNSATLKGCLYNSLIQVKRTKQ
ncbi:MAG: M48 family metallopeptidase [Salibacteraceae bacterium]